MRNAVLSPRRPAWAITTALIIAGALVAYGVASSAAVWRPGRAGGLTAGIAATVLFVLSAAYPARRRLCIGPLRTAHAWLQLHIYGSALAVVLVLLHIDLRLPVGAFGWALFVAMMAMTLTGVIGVLLQKTIPVALANDLQLEAIYERIPELVSQLADEAEQVSHGASDTLARVYAADVKPILGTVKPQWMYVLDPRASRDRRLEPLTRVAAHVDGGDLERLALLRAIVNEKLDLDAHATLQRVLRRWVAYHVPPAILLMGLVAVHIFAVVYF